MDNRMDQNQNTRNYSHHPLGNVNDEFDEDNAFGGTTSSTGHERSVNQNEDDEDEDGDEEARGPGREEVDIPKQSLADPDSEGYTDIKEDNANGAGGAANNYSDAGCIAGVDAPLPPAAKPPGRTMTSIATTTSTGTTERSATDGAVSAVPSKPLFLDPRGTNRRGAHQQQPQQCNSQWHEQQKEKSKLLFLDPRGTNRRGAQQQQPQQSHSQGHEQEKEEITARLEQQELLLQQRAPSSTSDTGPPGAYSALPGVDPRRVAKVNFRLVGTTATTPSSNSAGDTGTLPSPPSTTPPARAPSVRGGAPSGPTNLAEARPVSVEETELPHAMELNPNDKERRARTMWRFFCKVFTVGVICIAVIVLAVVLTRDDESNATEVMESSPAQTGSPTASPTLSPEMYIKSLLPQYTVQQIEKNHASSQYDAFQFILKDVQSRNFTVQRLQQRFALATFYFATNGDGWMDQSDWLDHDIDECRWFSKVPKLNIVERVYFGGGRITETVAISTSPCTNGVYQHLAQYGNNLNGTLPPEVFELLPSLISMNLDPQGAEEGCTASGKCGYANRDFIITGSIPSEIGLCRQMKYLSLENQRLSGSLPSSLGQLSLLAFLRLYDNTLTGELSTAVDWTNLPNLERLELGLNFFNGTIPPEIGFTSGLISLDLWCKLSGTIPTEIGLLSHLTWLELGGNGLIGSIPSETGLLTSLTSLHLGGSHLLGSIPTEIVLLSSLEELDIWGNGLTGAIPSEIGLALRMKGLYLYFNNLSGFIPSEIGRASSMEYLYLYFNNLSGSIPSEIGRASSMEWLDLSSNRLTGTIPSEIGHASSIEGLDLSNNTLTGTIPSEVGLASNLTYLYLSNNELLGSIPSELGQLSLLELLDLSRNGFTGSIPQEAWELCNFAATTVLVFGNNFTGSAPAEINLCRRWPGQFPLTNSTHELIINIQYDDYPQETKWFLLEDLSHECILSSSSATYEHWNITAEKGSDVKEFDQTSISQTVHSNTFYRFELADSYGDGFSNGWATITTATVSNATATTDANAGTVLWAVDSNSTVAYGTVVYLWVDANGWIEVVEDGANQCQY